MTPAASEARPKSCGVVLPAPVASNKTEECRAKNRRMELVKQWARCCVATFRRIKELGDMAVS